MGSGDSGDRGGLSRDVCVSKSERRGSPWAGAPVRCTMADGPQPGIEYRKSTVGCEATGSDLGGVRTAGGTLGVSHRLRAERVWGYTWYLKSRRSFDRAGVDGVCGWLVDDYH